MEQARERQPDLVLLDLSMPAVDGSEALSSLLDAAPAAKVVILSGMDAAFVGPLLDCGAAGFLPKG